MSVYIAGTKPSDRFGWWWLAVFLLANLPDVDLVFGFFEGNPNLYHHFWTHSLAFVVGVGSLIGFGYWFLTRRRGIRFGWVAVGVLLSHLVLDFFTKDTSPPFGVQLLWPVSEKFFISPVALFRDVSKASSSNVFLKSLFCWHNLWTVLLEVVLLGPLLVWVKFLKKKS